MERKAAILITAYNRYRNFKILLNFLIKYKVKIYVSIDGPKNEYDKIEQLKIISLIKKNKIKYRVLEKNYGCQKAVLSALDWFFLIEKKGIILEDDILPGNDFFRFCNELLVKYRNNKKIFSISGFNPLNKNLNIDGDYFHSKFFMCWGWATWKDRWLVVKKYLPKEKWNKLLKSKEWKSSVLNDIENKYFIKIYKKILLNQIDSWAFLWLLIGISNSSKFILPKKNLTINTGTKIKGANNIPSKLNQENFKIYSINNIKHPKKYHYNSKIDLELFYLTYKPKNTLYPWRFLFLLRCLFLDPTFFFSKVISFLKRNRFIFKIAN